MRLLRFNLIVILTAAAVGVAGFVSQAQAEISLHVSLVVDADGGTNGNGAVFRIDPATGERRVLIDFGDREPLAATPSDVTIDPSGDLLVTDRDAGTLGRGVLFRVNPTTGERRILSDFGDPDLGPQGAEPVDVAIDPSSHAIFVLDRAAGTNGRGALFRLVRSLRFGGGFPFFRFVVERRLVSDFGVGEPLGVAPVGLAIDADGDIVVVDHEAGTDRRGALFRITPATHHILPPFTRELISDFGVGEPRGESPAGLAIVEERFERSSFLGSILVIDPNAGTQERGALFRVNPFTGARTLISDFGVGEPRGVDPQGVAVDGFGNIQVIDTFARPGFEDAGRGALFEVNPRDGTRTVISDFNDAVGITGPLAASDVAIVPVPLVVDADAEPDPRAELALGALFAVDPFTGGRTLLNDFEDLQQGNVLGHGPRDVAIEGPNSILVIDRDAGPLSGGLTSGTGVLFKINPSTCNPPCRRTALCTGLGFDPVDVAVDVSGNILVTDITASVASRRRGSLYRVEPSGLACRTTVVSDFGNSKQGTLGCNPHGLALVENERPVVMDPCAGGDRGILFEVDPADGKRDIITNFNTGNPKGVTPLGVAIEATRSFLVIDVEAGSNRRGALFRVDPSGERTLLSDFGDGAPQGVNPADITVEASGNILAIDYSAGTGRLGGLFRVDPRNGARRLISDFGTQSFPGEPLGSTPVAVGVTLTPTEVRLVFASDQIP